MGSGREELLKSILTNLPGYVMVLDRRARIQFVNRVGPKLSIRSVFGVSLMRFLQPKFRPGYLKALAAAFRGEVTTVRYFSLGKGSAPSWFEDRLGPLRQGGRVAAVVVISQKISDKVRLEQAEENLRRLRERFENVFNHSSDGMMVTDTKGVFTTVNPAFCQMTGYRKSELVNSRHFADITAPEDRPRNLRSLRRMQRAGEPMSFEKVYLRKDGSRLPVLLTVFPLKDGSDRVTAFGSIVRDVTERRRSDLQARAAAESKQVRLGRDLHDGIGQYMTGISMMSRTLELSLGERGLAQEARHARRITEAATAAVLRTRSMAQGLIPTELAGGLRGALRELSRNAKNLFGSKVRVSCPDQLAVEDQKKALNLYQIAQEAVHNACRHGKARNVWIDVLLGRKPGMGLRILDDGVGLPRRIKPGLGLRTMTERAAVLGGSLEILPRRGKGVMVVCRFSSQP